MILSGESLRRNHDGPTADNNTNAILLSKSYMINLATSPENSGALSDSGNTPSAGAVAGGVLGAVTAMVLLVLLVVTRTGRGCRDVDIQNICPIFTARIF